MNLPRLTIAAVAFSVCASLPATSAEYTMRLAHAQPATDAMHLLAAAFKEKVEASTDSQVEVKIFPSGQLGKIRDTIEGLRLGTIQVVVDGPARLSVYTPKGDIFKLPYLVGGRDEGETLWTSAPGQQLLDDIADESGIQIIALAWRGARHITANRKIESPADMAGLKIRVPPYELPIKIFETLGAAPTPMSFNEVYLALQQGIVDAQENPLTTNWTNRFQEVTDYLVLTGHMKAFISVMMGQQYLDTLPAEIQEAVKTAAREAAVEIGDQVEAQQEELIGKFRDAGVEVIEPDIAAFEAAFDGFTESYNPDLVPVVEQLKAAD